MEVTDRMCAFWSESSRMIHRLQVRMLTALLLVTAVTLSSGAGFVTIRCYAASKTACHMGARPRTIRASSAATGRSSRCCPKHRSSHPKEQPRLASSSDSHDCCAISSRPLRSFAFLVSSRTAVPLRTSTQGLLGPERVPTVSAADALPDDSPPRAVFDQKADLRI